MGLKEEPGSDGEIFASSNSAADIGRDTTWKRLTVVASDFTEGDLVCRGWSWVGRVGKGFCIASIRRRWRVLTRRRGPGVFVILFGLVVGAMAVTRGIFLRSRAVGSSVRGWRTDGIGAWRGRKFPSFRRRLMLRSGLRGLPRESFRGRESVESAKLVGLLLQSCTPRLDRTSGF